MIIFAIKSAITLAVLYSCFFLLLSRETFHRFNRWMLIGMMVASLVVPFIHITTEHPTVINNIINNATQATHVEYYADTDVFIEFTWESRLIIVYLIGFVVMIVFTIVQLVMIARNIRGGLRHTDDKGNTVVLKPGKFAPFSFLHYIVMSVDDYEHNRQAILTHEQEHIRLLHSWDNIFVSLMKVLQWFNPFIYLLSRDLNTVHEYEADEAVINNGIDAKTYQQLLVVKATGMRLQTLVNSLNRTSLKKRIIMMYQTKSNRWLMLKAIIALPVLAVTIGAFATPKIADPIANAIEKIDVSAKQMTKEIEEAIITAPAEPKETKKETEAPTEPKETQKEPEAPAKAEKAAQPSNAEETPVAEDEESEETISWIHNPDQAPLYPGGNAALMSFIKENLQRPVDIEPGTAIILTISIKKDGEVYYIGTPINNAELSQNLEALRKSMPNWTPARQRGEKVDAVYQIPLTF